MKKEILKAISAVMAVTLTAAIFVSCGRSAKEPEDSLVPTETYTAATVEAMDEDGLNVLIQEVLGEQKWDGDYSKLTDIQRKKIVNKMEQQGYNVAVTDNGVVYYDYVPTAQEDEIAEVVQQVLGEEKQWDGDYNSLSTQEKAAVRDKLNDRGYDVDLGKDGFEFKNEAIRREETTSPYYNSLPSREQIAAAVANVLGNDGYSKWDGSMASLTKKQQEDILQQLNDYGFDLAVNGKGEFYIIHSPSNTVTFEKAYTAAPIGGTTQAPTAPATTKPTGTTENRTGTTATEVKTAPKLESTKLSGFGGTGGDGFYDVAATSDGGYIAVAQFRSKDGDFAGTDSTWGGTRSAVVKFDKNGRYTWKTTLGDMKKNLNAENGVTLAAIAELADGSFIAVGYADARTLGTKKGDPMDAILLKVSAAGEQEWLKRFSGSEADEFLSVAAAPDGGFVVGGFTYSSDGDFSGLPAECDLAILMKFNASGEKQWMQSYNGGTNAAQISAVAVTGQGYIYASCNAACALGSYLQLDMAKMAGYGKADAIVMKFTPEGEMIAYRAIAGSGNDQIDCIAVADGGGVVIGGASTRNNRDDSVFAGKFCQGKADAFVIRLDASLRVEWVNVFGGADNDLITDIVPVKGGYVAVGRSSSNNVDFGFLSGEGMTDGFLLTLSENGSDVGKYALSGNNQDICFGVAAPSAKKIVVVGMTNSTTHHFSAISPTPVQNPVCFIEWLDVK